MKKLVIFVRILLVLLIILVHLNALGQKETRDTFKIVQPGLEFGLSYMNPEEINAVFNSWITSLGYILADDFSGGIHLGISGAGFLMIRPAKFLEIRPLYEVIDAPYLMFSSDGQRYNINILSHGPGISAGLIAGAFRMGGGITRNFSTINWNDLVFDNDDRWKGKTNGYHVYIGYNSDPDKSMSYTISLEYQNIMTNQLLDSDNQIVTEWDSSNKLRLNLSGFALKFGYYFGR